MRRLPSGDAGTAAKQRKYEAESQSKENENTELRAQLQAAMNQLSVRSGNPLQATETTAPVERTPRAVNFAPGTLGNGAEPDGQASSKTFGSRLQ